MIKNINFNISELRSYLIRYASAKNRGFQYVRKKFYGINELSYDGKGCSYLYCNHINEGLKGKICYHSIDVNLCFTGHGYAVHDHCYIVSNDKIIDPTFKQLFINTTGSEEKLFSPYAEYLYKDLPVIFEGTREEFKHMVHKIEQLKKTDVLHSNYSIHPIAYMMAEEIKE